MWWFDPSIWSNNRWYCWVGNCIIDLNLNYTNNFHMPFSAEEQYLVFFMFARVLDRNFLASWNYSRHFLFNLFFFQLNFSVVFQVFVVLYFALGGYFLNLSKEPNPFNENLIEPAVKVAAAAQWVWIKQLNILHLRWSLLLIFIWFILY